LKKALAQGAALCSVSAPLAKTFRTSGAQGAAGRSGKFFEARVESFPKKFREKD